MMLDIILVITWIYKEISIGYIIITISKTYVSDLVRTDLGSDKVLVWKGGEPESLRHTRTGATLTGRLASQDRSSYIKSTSCIVNG